MPRISEFYGIVIRMFHDDHPQPHFHARYAEYQAKVSIASGLVIAGDLPVRAARFVREWARIHRAELLVDWDLVMDGKSPIPIEPLA